MGPDIPLAWCGTHFRITIMTIRRVIIITDLAQQPIVMGLIPKGRSTSKVRKKEG